MKRAYLVVVAFLVGLADAAFVALTRYMGRSGAISYLAPGSYPTLETFAANQVGRLGKMEILWQPLWDSMLYPTAGVLNLLFFQTPQGQGQSAQPIAAAAVKSAQDTNMTQPGQLAAPQAFWVDGIECQVQAGSVSTANLFASPATTVFAAANAATVQTGENDESLILSSGMLSLTIMQKEYYREAPLFRFPPRSVMRLDGNQSTTSATAGIVSKNKLWNAGKPVKLDPGFGIATSANFQVALTWPAVVATAANNARIVVYLPGWLFRAAQ